MAENFKIIVAGGRYFTDYEKVKEVCDKLLQHKIDVEIVSGGASGADHFGERYAKERQLRCTIFPAKWDKHGNKAGPIRNTEMSNYADALIAFWNGRSPGTSDMIKKAKRKELDVRIVDVTYPTKR